jgi:methylated-DNA-[protein]-cysteine S-methyltransferase
VSIYYTTIELPTGPAYAAATPVGLTRLSIRRESLSGFLSGVEAEYGTAPVEDDRPFASLRRELGAYFRGEPVSFTVRLDITGTEFQKRVWRELTKIPYGNLRSYKWLASMAGNPLAARAVGGALNKNRVPIIIPCHRVVESSGGLGGFGCGLDVKARLLEVEGVLPSIWPRIRLSIPSPA